MATVTTHPDLLQAPNGSAPPLLSGEELIGRPGPLPEDGPLAESCRYAVATTGKQLRSRLVLEASQLGNPGDPRVREAARAVELFHAATLAHDDVVDDSNLRRGLPTVEAQLGGFAAGYTGGWLFATAVECATRCGDSALEVFVGTACDVCDGEMLETQDLYNTDRTEERYLDAIAGKTARLFAASARLGGLASGASGAAVEGLGDYGESLGMAFQLSDDILDLVPGGGVPGKEPGDDLRHGVYTLPVIYALESDDGLRERLASDVQAEDLPVLVDAIRATGAVERALAVCDEYCARAKQAAHDLGAPSLAPFADHALERLTKVRES